MGKLFRNFPDESSQDGMDIRQSSLTGTTYVWKEIILKVEHSVLLQRILFTLFSAL